MAFGTLLAVFRHYDPLWCCARLAGVSIDENCCPHFKHVVQADVATVSFVVFDASAGGLFSLPIHVADDGSLSP